MASQRRQLYEGNEMKINIIGGGTSGWWTAGYLRKMHPSIEITLIESKGIGAIGVGESTMPNVRAFFEELDINEEAWLDTCSATRKYGNIRTDFDKAGGDPMAFKFIHEGFDEWFADYKAGNVTKESMYDLYDPSAWRGYAYHLDSAQAWRIVRDQTPNINHIYADITCKADLPAADLHIDCSGLHRLLVADRKFITYDNLINNTCVVRRCTSEIDNYTHTHAMTNGWQFTITLSDNRAGIGYVFDDQHISIEDAKLEHATVNADREWLSDFRVLKWNPGRLDTPWVGDVVAVGMSAGFIEPLESNALSILIAQIRTLSKVLLKPNADKIYNRMSGRVIDEAADFIWHNYALTDRDDTSYWKQYADLDGTKSLQKRIESNINVEQHLFPSYVYAYLGIYYGLY